MYYIFSIDIYIYIQCILLEDVVFVGEIYIQFQVKLKWEIDRNWGNEHSTRSNLYHILSLWFVWDLWKCLDFLQQVTVVNVVSQIDPKKRELHDWIGLLEPNLWCLFLLLQMSREFAVYLRLTPRWVGLKHHVPPFLREISTYPVMQRLPMTRHVRHASRTWNCESFEKSSETM